MTKRQALASARFALREKRKLAAKVLRASLFIKAYPRTKGNQLV